MDPSFEYFRWNILLIFFLLENGHGDGGKIAGIVIGSVIGGILLIACICVLCIVALLGCRYSAGGGPFRSNKAYVRAGLGLQNEMGDALFRPGAFSGYYFNNGVWRGSEQFTLAFYPQADQTVFGKGTDEKGTFVVNGIYSPRTLRMAFDKQYQAGSMDSARHPNARSTIQVGWNPQTQSFEGKYYAKTATQKQEGKYTIRAKGANYPRR